MSGQKIIKGLEDAVAGNFSRVTIDGQVWVRRDAYDDMLAMLQESALQLEYLADKFGETGSGASVLARTRAAIRKAEGQTP